MSHATDRSPQAALRVTFLTTADCHLCERGRAVLAELQARQRLAVREVDLRSVEGRQLAARMRVPFPPAVVVEGRLLAHGRLSVRGLARQLATLNIAHGPKADRTG